MLYGYFLLAALVVILLLVFTLPFSVKKAEEELEVFLLVMGILAVSVSGMWSRALLKEAVSDPVKIFFAVLLAGFAFRAARGSIRSAADRLLRLLGPKPAVFAFVFFLGLSSSVITAIVAALVLAEVITVLEFDRKTELWITVCACYSIGLGAVLTPVGEPLSTIVTAKLSGAPHNAGFFFLAKLLWLWIIPGLAVLSACAAWKVNSRHSAGKTLAEDRPETIKDIVNRAIKVYIFILALVLLGTGLGPLAEKIATAAPDWALYWINSVSAILDNATLAAAEIVPPLTNRKIIFVLTGLLLAGGMLIPGNIPNIVSASKLGIRSREWAGPAVPLGLALMSVYFIILLLAL